MDLESLLEYNEIVRKISQTKMKDFSFITHTHLVKDLV